MWLSAGFCQRREDSEETWMSLKIFLLLIQTNLFLTLIYQLLVLLQFSCLFFSNCLFSQIWVTLFIPLRAALTIIVYCVLWIFFMQDVFSGLHYWINMFSATHSSFVYYHMIIYICGTKMLVWHSEMLKHVYTLSCRSWWTMKIIGIGMGFTTHCKSHTGYTPSRVRWTADKKPSERE